MDNKLKNKSKDLRNQTPKLEKKVYDNLPSILSDLVSYAQNDREKDILLLSGLTAYGALGHNITGWYRNELIYPNLYCCIIAPAASGKGIMKKTRQTVQKIHNKFSEIYKSQLCNYKEKVVESKKDKNMILPPQPKRRLLLIPGNISSAALIENLEIAYGTGIIIETEIDTLTIANNSEYGNFSDILRKNFHQETISVSRKTDSEYIEVQNPRFGIVVSGTPEQITGLLKSAEDGLFSRFCFYTFSDKRVIDIIPRPQDRNKNDQFFKLQDKVYKYWEWQNSNSKEITLTGKQWKELNDTIIAWEKDFSIISEELQSTAVRLGIIAFKVMMVLTTCRAFEGSNPINTINVIDEDFNRAISIIKKLKEHGELVYNALPKRNSNLVFKNSKQRLFWDSLPESFSRKKAVETGKPLQVKERTVDKFLKDQVYNGNLEKVATGQYKKL